MSAKNVLLSHSNEQSAVGEELSTSDTRSGIESRKAGAVESEGSIWSHLAWGLGSLALVSPLFIPGIPMGTLMVAYLYLMGAVVVGCIIWNFLNTRPPKG